MSRVRGSVVERVRRQAFCDSVGLTNCQEGDLLDYVYSVIAFKSVDDIYDVNSRDEFNFTPLMKAVQFGDITLCRFLLSIGADVNAVGSRLQGRTPLMLAVFYGRKDVASLLLMSGADLNIKDAYGQTAEDLCITHKEDALLKIIQDFK